MKYILVAIILFIPVSYGEDATLNIQSPQYVSKNFTISLKINSSVPLAGAQCNILFNESVVHAVDVKDGGMFKMWAGDISPNFPLIDNKNGSIKNIVAFDIGNTTLNGTFATINFSVVGEGNAGIRIQNLILSDKNSEGVSAVISNSTTIVDLTPPFIKDINISVDRELNITCLAGDNICLGSVKINITFPDGSKRREEMVHGDKFFFTHQIIPGNYTFFICAIDCAENKNISSQLEFQVNNTVPIIMIDNPVNGSVVHGNIMIRGRVINNSAIKRVEIKIDDGEWRNIGNTLNYEWDTSSVKNGLHKIYVRAYDGREYSNIFWVYVNVRNNMPVNTFQYEPLFPYVNETVYFYGGDGESWLWDFGDGNRSIEKNPHHKYGREGKYNVSLVIVKNGVEYHFEKRIVVYGRINFSVFPSFPSPGMIVKMSAYPSDMLNYTWQFGDGNIAYGRNVTHVYTEGNYTVSLSVLDKNGRKVNRERGLRVEYPDFYIDNFTYIRKGNEIVISGMVKNCGGYIPAVKIAFYVNDEEVGMEEKNISCRIANFTKEIRIEGENNKIGVFADPDNEIPEINEYNNFHYISIHSVVPNIIYYFIPAAALISAILLFIYLHARNKIKIVSDGKYERCGICLGKFKDETEIVRCSCGATFHKSCAERVKVCPVCGRKLI